MIILGELIKIRGSDNYSDTGGWDLVLGLKLDHDIRYSPLKNTHVKVTFFIPMMLV